MSPPINHDILENLIKRVEALEAELAIKKSNKQLLTIDELSKRTGFSINTLYKLRKNLTFEVHYFKPNGGKLLFDESAVDFLVTKGDTRHGKSIHEKGQPVYLGDFLSQQKEV